MENIRRGFVCVSEHKSHSQAIKAARLVTHQDVLNTFFPSLCSPLALLSFLAPPTLLHTCLKAKMDSSPSAHSTTHLICMNGAILFTPLHPPPCSCLHALLPPLSKGCTPAPLAETPSHCKTNESVTAQTICIHHVLSAGASVAASHDTRAGRESVWGQGLWL